MGLNTPQFGTLQGLKVVCAGAALAGPHGGVLLAENGAEVIHVEDTRIPDVMRGVGKGLLFALEHRNVYELGLNIPSPEGKKAFERLIKWADVLIEASKGGQYEKWGLSDEVLWKLNSKLVIAHVSGYGQSGDPKYVKRASYDFTGQAFSGYTNLNGLPEPNPPAYAKPVTCDYWTGTNTAMAVMMALYRVQKTGVGESIDITQYESLLRVQQYQSVAGFTDGVVPKRYDGIDPLMAGDAFYKCKDGKYVSIFMAGESVISRGTNLIGLGDDPDFKNLALINKSDTELSEKYLTALRSFTSNHTAEEVDELFNANGVPCARLMTYEDMLANPHYQARQDIVEFHSTHIDRVIKAPAAFPKFARNPQQIWRGGAKHGEDNEAVLEELGYSDEEIKTLYESNAVVRLK